MIVKDFFSHKIHSSKSSWSDKLITIATIFNEFDGKPYIRDKIEKRLSEISPRISGVRDASKIRDEISAYSSYLGVYKLELVDDIWHVFLTETAKRLLISEEPDVASFLILQLSLFQFPNCNGVSKTPETNKIRVQANARDKTQSYLTNKVILSPLRLICKAILATSQLENAEVFDVTISKKLLFVLANDSRTNNTINPSVENTLEVIAEFNSRKITTTSDYESRFHLLKHTGLIKIDGENISLRTPENEADKIGLLQKFHAICSLSIFYDGFDECDPKNDEDIIRAIKSDYWGKYFDGIATLPMDFCQRIISDVFPSTISEITVPSAVKTQMATTLYEFRTFDFSKQTHLYSTSQSKKSDPEVTKVLRQRANLTHKVLLEKLHNYLMSKDIVSFENEHIDLYAPITDDVRFIFEVKSLSPKNLLSQARKGLSQLYEYRYRYRDTVGMSPKLCLVFPNEPLGIDWLQNYLIEDRKINIMWFDQENQPRFPDACQDNLLDLLQA